MSGAVVELLPLPEITDIHGESFSGLQHRGEYARLRAVQVVALVPVAGPVPPPIHGRYAPDDRAV